MAELTRINLYGTMYYIDFRLEEIREIQNFHNSHKFEDLSEEKRALIRGARATYTNYGFIKSLDK